VDELRTSGNELFKAGKYVEAEAKYTEALEVEPLNHLLLSNRSLARCGGKRYDLAIRDARECLKVAPSFVKGYYRLASAQVGLGLLDEALVTVRQGLKVEEENPELKKLSRTIKAKKHKDLTKGRGGDKDNDKAQTQQQKDNPSGMTAEKQREIGELARTLRAREKEKNDVAARATVCRREIARSHLTSTEVADLPDDTTLYRAVGKIFLEAPKPKVLDLLDADKASAEQRASSLAARLAFLDREIHSKESELKAIAG